MAKLNLSRVKLVAEHPSHWLCDDGAGRQFKVLKGTAHDEAIAAHFAQGGEVGESLEPAKPLYDPTGADKAKEDAKGPPVKVPPTLEGDRFQVLTANKGAAPEGAKRPTSKTPRMAEGGEVPSGGVDPALVSSQPNASMPVPTAPPPAADPFEETTLKPYGLTVADLPSKLGPGYIQSLRPEQRDELLSQLGNQKTSGGNLMKVAGSIKDALAAPSIPKDSARTAQMLASGVLKPEDLTSHQGGANPAPSGSPAAPPIASFQPSGPKMETSPKPPRPGGGHAGAPPPVPTDGTEHLAPIAASLNEAQAAVSAQEAAMAKAHADALEAHQNAVKQMVDQYSDSKVDPSHFWASRSTGDKILAAVGLALGAFSPDGNNRAAAIIDKAVDRDINVQKDNLAQKKDAIGEQKNLLGIMREKFGDEATALAATRLTKLQYALNQVDQYAAQYHLDPVKVAAFKEQLSIPFAKDVAAAAQAGAAAAEHHRHNTAAEYAENMKARSDLISANAKAAKAGAAGNEASDEAIEGALKDWHGLGVGQDAERRTDALARTALLAASGRAPTPEAIKAWKSANMGWLDSARMIGNPEHEAKVKAQIAAGIKRMRDARAKVGSATVAEAE